MCVHTYVRKYVHMCVGMSRSMQAAAEERGYS